MVNLGMVYDCFTNITLYIYIYWGLSQPMKGKSRSEPSSILATIQGFEHCLDIIFISSGGQHKVSSFFGGDGFKSPNNSVANSQTV